jgi:hypothetical protein
MRQGADKVQGMCAGFYTAATGTSERAMPSEFCKIRRPNLSGKIADTSSDCTTLEIKVDKMVRWE